MRRIETSTLTAYVPPCSRWLAMLCRCCFLIAAVAVTVAQSTAAQAQDVAGELQDDPAAQEAQARSILDGNGSGNIAAAIELLEAAAAAGRTTALLMLGDIYSDGEHAAADFAASLRYYRRAAELGAADGFYALGWLYFAPNDTVERDAAAAAMWFRAAAHQQHPEAMLRLAYMHFRGDGVDRDLELAFELLRRAAELGSAQAAVDLANEQLRPDSEWFDRTAGEFWLDRWAESGYVPAQRSLGMHLLTGKVLPRNLERAASVLAAAGRQGDSFSGLWAAEMLERGLGVQANKVAASLMRRSALETASASAINSVAWDLAVQPDGLLRNGAVAVTLMERVMTEPDNRRPTLLDTLAAAYAEAGDFDAAVRTQIEAIGLIPEDQRYDAMRSAFIERQRLYEDGEPYREGTQ